MAKKSKSRAKTKRAVSKTRQRVTAGRGSGTAPVVVAGSGRPPAKLTTRVADIDPNAVVEVTLTLRGPSLPGADDLSGSTLSPDEFARLYGASPEDLRKVTSTLEKYGLVIDHASLATRSVLVTGTARQMEAAFRPNLGLYKDATGRVFRDRQSNYVVPKALSGIVTAVLGFGQRSVARRRSAVARTAGLKPLTPEDIESLYQFPAQSAHGASIGIAEFGGGFFAEDLAAYCQKYGRPVPKVRAISKATFIQFHALILVMARVRSAAPIRWSAPSHEFVRHETPNDECLYRGVIVALFLEMHHTPPRRESLREE